jgi:glycosyltransferase involved in cell wall biosynthesis
MSGTPAPIALFAYRRPDHLRATIDSLRRNPEARESELYVFSDAPRDEEATAGVEAVRLILRELEGFRSVNVIHRQRNFGLASNITKGVADVLASHDSVIVLEDDIVVSPFFLRFMNAALTTYREEPRVGSISGYCYPLNRKVGETFFLRGADCWGWATWRDRWSTFNPDGRALLSELRSRGLTDAFDIDGAMGFTRMLEDQLAGRNDSWAVRWHASCFLKDLLILYPARPLARNIGQDGSGTHETRDDNAYDVRLSPTPVKVGGVPIEESSSGRAAVALFFRHPQPPKLLDWGARAARDAAQAARAMVRRVRRALSLAE